MPNSSARWVTSWAISAALTRAFVGMHPRVIQVPPIGPGSKSITLAPRRRASSAALMPAIPPPRMATSTGASRTASLTE